MAPPEMTADLIGEFLLRLPPDDPASLVRAFLVCKLWRRILADPTFPCRYRAFHRDPPLLGFFLNRAEPHFVPTTAPSPVPQPALDYDDCFALDCRHGRVLFVISGARKSLVVWDPITGDRQELSEPPTSLGTYLSYCTAAVLCSVRGCDHLHCDGGPYLVVAVVLDRTAMDLMVHVYKSEAGTWNASSHLGLAYRHSPTRSPSVLIGDDVYFAVTPWYRFLLYDLGSNSISASIPPKEHDIEDVVLMPLENGLLGLAGVFCLKLCLWSRDVDLEGVGRWVQFRVIELEKLITVMPIHKAEVVGSAEGVGIIFVATDVGTFSIELKSGWSKMIGKPGDYFSIPTFPFMSFYTPDYASRKLSMLAGNTNDY